ncbi:MAG TPA: sialidase family protein [Candidatus Thermoplasmatota archaeon]|nr:sialidase family protein [Candidatus Thermoplasmatota archaeon]
MRAALVLLAGLLAAGCVTPSAGPLPSAADHATLCVAGLCDLEATVEPDARQANELSIAVNPLDPLNIIATGKDYTPGQAGDCTWAGVYATHDGGKTWTDQNVPGSPWARLADPTAPQTMFTKYWCATDPVVAFGPDGRAYWTVMPYQCDPATGSKTGRGTLPQGGFNDWAWSCSAMAVLVSDDGGDTWPLDKARIVVEGPRLAHDKQWLAVSPAGDMVLLCWDYANPVGQTAPLPASPPDADDPLYLTQPSSVVCSKSTDRGDTWSAMTVATDAGGFPWIDFSADGHVWMALAEGFEEGQILVTHSEDGLTWDEPVPIANFTNGPERNEYGWPTLRGSLFRLVPYGSLAVDRSAAHAGRVYVTYFDHAGTNGEALLTWSDDHGTTWTAPKRVSDDAGEADQFMPVVSVGPDGTVDLSWQDRRDDAQNHLFDTYYAYSVDGGATLSRNVRITSVSSDEQWSHHQNGMVFLGDYRDSDSAVAGRASFVWVDTRHEKADVFVATVERPSAMEG